MVKLNRKKRTLIINFIVILAILAGLVWILSLFIHIGTPAFTDNAQIRQDIVPVNSRIQGFVKEVLFDEFQPVRKGDTLMIIEDTEFVLQLAQAQANYQNALVEKTAMGTTIKTTQNNISVSDANLDAIRIQLENAEAEYQRYQKLLEKESVTKQQYDVIETQYKVLKARYEMQVRQQESTKLVKSEQTQRLDQNQAAIHVAEAALKLAQLNLSYTIITAPCDGYTTRKNVNVGELIQPGQNIVSIVNNKDCWVVANFREKQMRHIQNGTKVKITVDAIPHLELEGYVSAISNATGAQYAIVPQDNSTGNFVKVEQRIPVKIRFTDNNKSTDLDRLSSGMNVECKIAK